MTDLNKRTPIKETRTTENDRFSKMSNGNVFDEEKSLEWLMRDIKPDTWINICTKKLPMLKHFCWRLPTINELTSAIDHRGGPLYPEAFPFLKLKKDKWYWTMEVCKTENSNVYQVHIGRDGINDVSMLKKGHVKLVRTLYSIFGELQP